MKIGSVSSKQFTKKEIIELIDKTFPDDVYDEYSSVCVITEISEYKGEQRQSIIFAQNLKW